VQPDDITRADILGWLGMAEGPLFCPNGRTLNLGGRFKTGNRQVVRVGCDAWSCAACGHRKRIRMGVHLGWRFVYSPAPVAEEFCQAERWHALRKWLHKRESEFAKVADPAGGWWVFHTGDRCGSAFGNPEAAVRRLGERLLAVRPEKRGRIARPVVTCRVWSLPEREGEFKLLGLLPVANPERVRNALREAEMPMRETGRDDRREWGFSFQADAGASLVVVNGRFVVIPGSPAGGDDTPYGEPLVWIRSGVPPTPYFSVRTGADGPELVAGPPPDATGAA
jgi:hypothetical protein